MNKDTENKTKTKVSKREKAVNFIQGKTLVEKEEFSELKLNKKKWSKDKITKNTAKETLALAHEAWKHYKRKFWISYGLLIGLNLAIVIISSLMIILNLFALRWNTSVVKEIIYYFIAIAVGSLIITFLTSITSFFSFSSKREIYINSITFLEAKLEQYKLEEIVDLHDFVNELGRVDTDF